MNARDLLGRARTRAAAAGTATLLAGGLAASVLLPAGAASAATCTGTALSAGTSCTLTGTATVSAGTLALSGMPTAMTWNVTLNGLDQQLGASLSNLQVNDATGSGAGWNMTFSATTFTTGSKSLPSTGAMAFNGNAGLESATTAPDGVCASSSTCTVPTNTTAYPVTVTTAASSPTTYKIFDTSAATGMGTIQIGSAHIPGLWLNLPASTYTSTFTWAITSAP